MSGRNRPKCAIHNIILKTVCEPRCKFLPIFVTYEHALQYIVVKTCLSEQSMWDTLNSNPGYTVDEKRKLLAELALKHEADFFVRPGADKDRKTFLRLGGVIPKPEEVIADLALFNGLVPEIEALQSRITDIGANSLAEKSVYLDLFRSLSVSLDAQKGLFDRKLERIQQVGSLYAELRGFAHILEKKMKALEFYIENFKAQG